MKSIGILATTAVFLLGCTHEPPPQRIYHVLDFHYVDRSDFAADLRDQNPELTDDEISERYAVFLEDVSILQADQMDSIRSILHATGLRKIFVEGVTDENVAAYRAKVAELKATNLAALVKRLNDAEDFAERALAIVEADSYQRSVLQLGAVGRLLITGEIVDVLPLDDAQALELANPKRLGFRFDGPENGVREMKMMERILAGGPVSIVVLGGGHDMRKQIAERCKLCEYHQIVLAKYTELQGSARKD